MKRYDLHFIKWFAILTLPSWAIIIIAGFRGNAQDWFNTCAGVLIVLWIISFMYILTKMVISQSYREALLTKLFKQKVSDEREMLLSGNAAKKTYYFSAAIILALLFISILKVSVIKPTKEEHDLGKKGTITIEFSYSVISKEAIKKDKTEFSIKELPISKEGILTLMLLLQLVSYHLYFRKKIAKS